MLDRWGVVVYYSHVLPAREEDTTGHVGCRGAVSMNKQGQWEVGSVCSDERAGVPRKMSLACLNNPTGWWEMETHSSGINRDWAWSPWQVRLSV